MDFIKTSFGDAWLIQPKVYKDRRGFFLEYYSKKKFEEWGIDVEFVQDNHSKSKNKGILRGLHFQKPPHAQTKLVRVSRGSVLDVIVDLRKDSKTYGRWESFKLSDKNFLMLYVPKGFAHGMCTLENNTEFMYKVDEFYAPQSDSGIIWNDPTLDIKWPFEDPILLDRDQELQEFKFFKSPF